MGSSLAVISLALLTLLIGVAIAAYQLWSADKAQKEGEHSALAARYGGKTRRRVLDRTNEANPHTPSVDVTRAADGSATS